MERTFLESANVIVTTSRFIVGSQTYVVRNITSVDVACIPPSRGFPTFLLLVGAVPLTANSLAPKDWANFLRSTDSTTSASGWSCIGVVVAVLALAWLITQSSRYVIILRTSGGEVRALESTKRKFIESVVAALDQSIISHA